MNARAARVCAYSVLLLVLLCDSGCFFILAAGHYADIKRRWHRDHAEEVAAFDRLAAGQHWKAVVHGYGPLSETISEVDFANCRIKHLYKTCDRIWRAQRLDDGRILAYVTPQERQEHTLVLVDPTGQQPARTIRPNNIPRRNAWPDAILGADGDHLFYQVNWDVIRYDLRTDRYVNVFHAKEYDHEWPYDGLEADGFLFLWFGWRFDPEEQGELMILRAKPPFEEVARFPRARIAMAGDRVLLSKEGGIYEFDPATAEATHVVDGRLVGVTDDAIAYCPNGTRGLTKPVLLYEFSKGASREILLNLEFEAAYWDRPRIFAFTPDLKYVFLTRSFRTCPPMTTFHVHEVETGKELGTFLNPYRGRIHVGQVFEWLN